LSRRPKKYMAFSSVNFAYKIYCHSYVFPCVRVDDTVKILSEMGQSDCVKIRTERMPSRLIFYVNLLHGKSVVDTIFALIITNFKAYISNRLCLEKLKAQQYIFERTIDSLIAIFFYCGKWIIFTVMEHFAVIAYALIAVRKDWNKLGGKVCFRKILRLRVKLNELRKFAFQVLKSKLRAFGVTHLAENFK